MNSILISRSLSLYTTVPMRSSILLTMGTVFARVPPRNQWDIFKLGHLILTTPTLDYCGDYKKTGNNICI